MTVSATTIAAYHPGGGSRCAGRGAPGQASAEAARTTASQLSQEKFPETISHSWVTMMIAAARLAYGCGANRPNGTMSWVRWLATTSTLCSGPGNRWKYQLSGPGIGCVSWW